MLNLQQISKANPILLPTLLKSIQDNRVFKKVEYRESFIKNINNLLSLRESRTSALSILNIFCDHHTVVNSPITEKTCSEISWIEQLLRIIEQEEHNHGRCFEILSKLLRITSGNPDTNKIVQSKFVQKIIESIVASSVDPQQSLNCLATCFELHGGTTGIYKNKIYDYCVSFIDLPNDAVAEKAGLCLHLLQQSRGGSVAGGVYKKCWAEFHEKTIGSLEELLQLIMKKEKNGTVGKSEKLQLPELKLSPEPFERFSQLFIRFQNLITVLRVSIARPFVTAKIFQVGRILSLIEDGITISQAAVGKKAITESVVLSLLHGQVHANLLEILKILLIILKQNSITHSKIICDILWRCLKHTSSTEQLKFEANLKLRSAVYEALICFMRVSPNNIHIKNVMENAMKEAFADVTPANDEICLMVPQQNGGGGKSNKKRKMNADKKFLRRRAYAGSILDEQEVCSKALEFLGYLLVSQGAIMKPVLFYVLQEKIVSIGFTVSSAAQQDGDLYRPTMCRIRLTDLIAFMMMHPVQKMPVPINYGIALLTQFKHADPDAKVREHAAMNLYRAETTIHNRKDVFYFPADYRDLRDTLLFNKQTIQKLNEPAKKEVRNEKTQTEEKEEDQQSDVVSENECDKMADEVEIVEDEDKEKLKPPQIEGDINEISDDEEVEEAQEISSDDEPEVVVPVEAKTTRAMTRKASEEIKRQADASPVVEKKRKICDKKEDDLLQEYLADFTDDV